MVTLPISGISATICWFDPSTAPEMSMLTFEPPWVMLPTIRMLLAASADVLACA
jgi:hypothetical protein